MKFTRSNIHILILAILPWSVHQGTTVKGNITLNVTIIQFWLFRLSLISDSSGLSSKFAWFAQGADPLLQFVYFFLSTAMLWTLFTHIRREEAEGEERTAKIQQEESNDLSDRFFKLVANLSFYAPLWFVFKLLLRDVHQTSLGYLGESWGYIVQGTRLNWGLPIGYFVVTFVAHREYRRDPYTFITSLSNKIRFTVIGLFVVISVFPLIWVVIVSLNTQTVIRSGTAIWPLDPSRQINFESYTRFFIFSGDPVGWIYLAFVLVLGGLAYHQINNPGRWEDGIQGFFYERVSKKLATNNATSVMFTAMIVIEIFVSVVLLSLIVSAKPFLTLPPGKFSWVIIDSTGQIRHIGNWFIITTIICTGVSLFGLVMACLSAYALSRFDFPAKTSFISVVLGTQMFPGIILLLPLLVMWNQLELTNSIFGLTLAYATFAVPFSTFMMKGYFDSIPKDLEEAAMVDGTTQLGAFTRVILPISLPGLSSTFLFSFLTGYTEYLLALTLYGAPEEEYTISLALINVFRTDFQNYYYPDLALFSIIVAMPILLMFVYLQKFLISGLATGGIKG